MRAPHQKWMILNGAMAVAALIAWSTLLQPRHAAARQLNLEAETLRGEVFAQRHVLLEIQATTERFNSAGAQLSALEENLPTEESASFWLAKRFGGSRTLRAEITLRPALGPDEAICDLSDYSIRSFSISGSGRVQELAMLLREVEARFPYSAAPDFLIDCDAPASDPTGLFKFRLQVPIRPANGAQP
jgi:hypothetical protein